MPARSLPPRPNLDQLKLQAKELLREYRDGKLSAAARIEAHHSKHKARLLLADAQLVLAREYGFENWAQLKERIERGRKIATIKPHPHFDEALAALRSGDINRLGELLVKHPELIRARIDTAKEFLNAPEEVLLQIPGLTAERIGEIRGVLNREFQAADISLQEAAEKAGYKLTTLRPDGQAAAPEPEATNEEANA